MRKDTLKMNAKFEMPEAEVLTFDSQDVITTSGNETPGYPPFGNENETPGYTPFGLYD